MTATVLDVIDNFFARDVETDIQRVPGRRLYELGRESRRLAQAREPIAVGPGSIYLGGWPSANFWAVSGDLIMSTLLYADSVVVKDPVTDWFSFSQYRVPHVMPTRPGFMNPETQEASVAETRAFLSNVIPALRALRPLIESGALVIVPSHDFNLQQSAMIESLAEKLMNELVTDARAYSATFAPGEIAIADNVRGMTLGVPGDQDASVRRTLRHGMRHFAREYLLSAQFGATYTAPFRHERFLCEAGLGSLVAPSDKVTTALMTTNLPILSNLTPAIVAKIRADDAYEEFRAQLHIVYAGMPVGTSEEEVARYLFDQERALLSGPLKTAERELSRGFLGRLGARLGSGSFNIAAGVALDVTLGSGGLATSLGAAKTATEQVLANRKTVGPQRVWNALVKHHRKVEQELTGVKVSLGEGGTAPYWGISETPSMSLSVMPGLILSDHIPHPVPDSPAGKYQEGAYAPCNCGSGLRYRYCCRGLKTDF